MSLIGLSTVRNEGDILTQAFDYAAERVDLLLIVDCGSDDDSVARIQEVCARHSNAVFLGAIGPHHARQVRRHVWHLMRPVLGPRDWWMFADADEFVADNVREVIRASERERADHIFSLHVNFYYTQREADEWQAGRETLADRARPIEERRRYYRLHTSQIRLFRHLPWLRWNEDSSYPTQLSQPASQRVEFRHFQYRDVPQIQDRIALRRSWSRDSDLMQDNPHWCHDDWAKTVSTDYESLKLAQPGQPFEPDAALPPAPQPDALKSLLRYGRAVAGARVRQAPGQFFENFDPREIIRHLRS